MSEEEGQDVVRGSILKNINPQNIYSRRSLPECN